MGIDFTSNITNNNFFATIGDYDTRSTFPDNASKILFSFIDSNQILRTLLFFSCKHKN